MKTPSSIGRAETPREFSAFVAVEPFAKERPEFITVRDPRTGKMRGGAKTRERTEEYETLLKVEFQKIWGSATTPLDGPLFAETWYYVSRPKSVPKKRRYPDTKPDLDNLDKAALDSLDFTYRLKPGTKPRNYGAVIVNDSRIVSKVSHKRYADTDSPYGRPGVFIRVRRMGDDAIAAAARQGRPMLCVVLPSGGIGSGLQDVVVKTLAAGYLPYLVPGDISAGLRRRLVADGEFAFTGYCVVAADGKENDLGTFVSEVGSRLDREVFRLAVRPDAD